MMKNLSKKDVREVRASATVCKKAGKTVTHVAAAMRNRVYVTRPAGRSANGRNLRERVKFC